MALHLNWSADAPRNRYNGDEHSRLMRSDVDLSPVGVFGLGRVVVHGSAKKMGVRRNLTPEERAAIDRALSGYLRALEEAYQDKLREDYPIFPAGRLRQEGVCRAAESRHRTLHAGRLRT
jgi:hypothetical protein